MLIDLAYIANLYQQNPTILPEMVWAKFCRQYCNEARESKEEFDHVDFAKSFANLSCDESVSHDLESKEMIEVKKEPRLPNTSFIKDINIYFEKNILDPQGKFAELIKIYLRCYPEYHEKFNQKISLNGLLIPLSEKELDEFVLSITSQHLQEHHPIIDIETYCEVLGAPFAIRIFHSIRDKSQLSTLNRISFDAYRGIRILCQIQAYLPDDFKEAICDHLLTYLTPINSIQKGIYNTLSFIPIVGFGISFLAQKDNDDIYRQLRGMRNLLSESYKQKVINQLKPLSTAESHALNSTLLNMGFDEEPAVYDMIISELKMAQHDSKTLPQDEMLSLLRRLDKHAFSAKLTQTFTTDPTEMKSIIFANLPLLDEFISENNAHEFFTLLYNIAMQPSWFYTPNSFMSNGFKGSSLSSVKHRYTQEQLDNYTLKTAKYLLKHCIDNEMLLSELKQLEQILSQDTQHYISQYLIDQMTQHFKLHVGNVLAKMPNIVSPTQKFNLLEFFASIMADAKDQAVNDPSTTDIMRKKGIQAIDIFSSILGLIPENQINNTFTFYCNVAVSTAYSIELRDIACNIISTLASMHDLKLPASLLQSFTEQMKAAKAENQKFAFNHLLRWNHSLTDLRIREELFTTLLDNFFKSTDPYVQYFMLLNNLDDMTISRQIYPEIFQVLKKFPAFTREHAILLVIDKMKSNIQEPDKTDTLNYLSDILKENRGPDFLSCPGRAAALQINVCKLHAKNVYSFGLFAAKINQANQAAKLKPGKSLLQKVRDFKDSRADPSAYAERQEVERFTSLYPFRLFNIIAVATIYRHKQIELDKQFIPGDVQDIIFDYLG